MKGQTAFGLFPKERGQTCVCQNSTHSCVKLPLAGRNSGHVSFNVTRQLRRHNPFL